ncbi:MAG: hypothetical protein AAGC63_09010, partial [Propionicimonas sp.]|nr:hypothetical protein [Propionicimonas sp.]
PAPEETPVPFTPVPPPSAPPSAADATGSRRGRLGWWILGIALVVVALLWFLLTRAGQPVQQVEPTPDPPVAIAVTQAIDFDPREDGGSAQENPRQAPLAIDGDTATAWQTERYRKLPTFGGLKPGVGLVLDLGSATEIRQVALVVDGGPTALEVRVPVEPADEPPLESQAQWRKVARAESGSGEVLLGFAAETTRFVLVYLTELPPVEDGYFRGAIAEAVVLG